jgi:hypothetical protein
LIPCSIRSGAIRASKNSARKSSREALEIIADNLKKVGWSLGWVSAVNLEGRTIWIVAAHADGKRFVVCAEENLTAFMELESAIRDRKRLAVSVFHFFAFWSACCGQQKHGQC